MFDSQFFGVNPHAFHTINLIFHAANSLLLLLVFHRLTGQLWRSAFVAALFALHPLHVESVAWVAERKDVVSTFFGLLTILSYIAYVRIKTIPGFLLVMALFILALMSKPMLVTLPVILLLLDFWPLKRFNLSAVKEKVPLLVLAVASSAITIWAQNKGGAVKSLGFISIGVRVSNAALAYWLYLGKMFWPARLAVFYPLHAVPLFEALLAAASLALITWFAFAKARKDIPYFFVGWLWFLVTLLPVIGVVQVGGQALADRYSYLPLVGPFIILAWGAADVANHFKWRQSVLAVGGATLILVLALTTRYQITFWKNGFTLFSHALEVTSDNFIAENCLADLLFADGKIEEAAQHVRKGLQINPTLTLYITAAKIDQKLGNPSEEAQCYRMALRLKPDAPDILNNLAWLLATSPDDKLRNGTEAVACAEKACQLSKYKQPVLIGTLAAAYAEAGRFSDAIATAQRASDTASKLGMSQVAKRNLELIEVYRAGHAYRDLDQ